MKFIARLWGAFAVFYAMTYMIWLRPPEPPESQWRIVTDTIFYVSIGIFCVMKYRVDQLRRRAARLQKHQPGL